MYVTLDPLKPCRRCIGRIACCQRRVDLAVKDILQARKIRADDDHMLWEHGRWTVTPHGMRRWSTWREQCNCCGKVYLVLLGGRIRIPVNSGCKFAYVPRTLCNRCRALVKRELGDKALLSYRQFQAGPRVREVNVRWNEQFEQYEKQRQQEFEEKIKDEQAPTQEERQ